ncbi:hypothetical protein IVB45_00335 [Bradyrhizobium sp. 4]|uniref:hypothetical protein n=1 Tax=unclassified Bradyrhizobium TaxID=2631580 RepID=UPI001FFA9AC7|nr:MULTISPECIES: hypothetical protein [unclassified Bradyrhizobium]MCK1397680.1 hypothetical protein [Bradyrhizobium sp. 39]MCK1749616.1 hypothetical protein [Bradyrhizobium sp. 135]UPJ35494.1 hypothetical protein IVB45_00335 [Bradyrhizobium sp. 4]
MVEHPIRNRGAHVQHVIVDVGLENAEARASGPAGSKTHHRNSRDRDRHRKPASERWLGPPTQRRKAHCGGNDKTGDCHRKQRHPWSDAGEIQDRGSCGEKAEAKRRRERPAHSKLVRRQKQGERKTNGAARERDEPNHQDIVHAASRRRIAFSFGRPDALSIQGK